MNGCIAATQSFSIAVSTIRLLCLVCCRGSKKYSSIMKRQLLLLCTVLVGMISCSTGGGTSKSSINSNNKKKEHKLNTYPADIYGEYAGKQYRFLEQVGAFTNYAFHRQLDAADRQWCNEDDHKNETLMTFNKYLNSCPSKSFAPRWLSAQQISWKSTRKEKN